MQEKILLVDDDVSILLLVSDVLEEKGLEVTAVRSGEEALRRVEEGRFDLILLDIMMKGLSGLEVCRQIRGRVDCPILFLSAKDSVKDIVKGLDLGADDYLTKPFALEELAARVQAHLRAQARLPAGRPRREAAPIQIGAIWLDPAKLAGERRGGAPVGLSTRELELLAYLMRNAGTDPVPGTDFSGCVADRLRGRGHGGHQHQEPAQQAGPGVALHQDGVGIRLPLCHPERVCGGRGREGITWSRKPNAGAFPA